ncbi:MAG TPA: DNA-processing protein DprA [Gemmatimonadales bacterium]|nr:DNA-processing protein DprA [Gemmatimonadales bacterium]
MAVDARAAYVALALTPGIGAVRLTRLLQKFDTPDGALSAPFAFLCTIPGMSRAAATAVCSAAIETGQRALHQVDELGGTCLLPDDPGFPSLLKEIPDPPTLLFAQGDLGALQRPAVAIVGSREHSDYGAEVARTIARVAAGADLVVVSGMARGLDAVAHHATLESGGATIGVLGNGLGVIYPAANRLLYERVVEKGLLLSEFAPGERPQVGSFPRRNRLISGLARVTVVVEAAAGSGTLITVEAALAQGREVMAVPGAITSPVSEGTNRLIRDGATPYLEPDDLLRHFPECPAGTAVPVEAQISLPLPSTLSDDEVAVAALIGEEPLHLDLLASQAERPIAAMLAVLSGLEIQGVVEQLPGWRFRRVGRR